MINNLATGKPLFFITIDTEPDNQWHNETFDKCENVHYLPRFQELCERYNFKPIYLTEYNIARIPFFINYIGKKAAIGNCEIGIHPHAWSTPPFVQLTSNDNKNKPFLIDYPFEIMEEKFKFLFDLLSDTFGQGIISHRAGRWAFNEEYLIILKKYGIKVDCSVLPLEVIPPSSQETNRQVSFLNMSPVMYEMAIDNIKNDGTSGIFEIPVTVINRHKQLRKLIQPFSMRICDIFFPNKALKQPYQNNLKDLLDIIDYAIQNNFSYLEFMIHSSQLMPGCSPTFSDEASIDKLYQDLDILFSYISKYFFCKTFKEFIVSCE